MSSFRLFFFCLLQFPFFHIKASAKSLYCGLLVHGVLCQSEAIESCYVFVKAPFPSAHLDLPGDCKVELALSLFTWPLI